MADETTLEIWSTKTSSLDEGERDLVGRVELEEGIRNLLDENIKLARNERLACLYKFGVSEYDTGLDLALLQPIQNRFDMIFKEAPFSWHLGLNKPKGKANATIADSLPNRHQIGLEAGILPMGIMGVTLTRDGKFLLGERDPKATHTVGNYCLVPAGFLSFGKPGTGPSNTVGDTFRREFFEEALYGPDFFDIDPNSARQGRIEDLMDSYAAKDSSPRIVGLTYEDRNNRGFGIPITFKTSFSSQGLDRYLTAKKPDVEHKGYLLREFSPESVEDLVREHGKAVEIHTLGALLCAGIHEFENGEEWYQRMVNEVVPKNYGKIMTLPENTFDEPRKVVEVIKETMPQRYPR